MTESIRNSSVAVGTSVVEITKPLVPGGVSVRTYMNTSTAGQIITLSFGADAVAGVGIVIAPGAFWSESIDSRFTPTAERLTAVASAANGTLAVHERIKSG